MVHGSRRLLGAGDDVEDLLGRAQERRARRREFLRRATSAVELLGEELAGEDARLEAAGLRLVAERRGLEAATNLARRQRDLDDEEERVALEASRVA